MNTPAQSLRAVRPGVPGAIDSLVLAMLAKQPGDRPEAEAVYETLLPFASADDASVGAGPALDRDPRRPFLRPLAPAPRAAARTAAAAAKGSPVPPLDVDEAIAVRERVRELVDDGHLQQAIDVLDDAVARARHIPELALEVKIDLASTLYTADEFSRAAPLLDEILPQLAARDGQADPAVLYLRYVAGVSHAEAGDAEAAIAQFTAFLAHADQVDPLFRDAKYQRGIMLHATGRAAEGLAELESVRPLLAAEYGPDSIHVRALDRRIAHLSRSSDGDVSKGRED
ncbi:hypothetical protein ACFQX7_33145 [Luedemannella flava]